MADFVGRLSKAPVVYALCQIRFAPVLKMGALVPDIQDQLRDQYDWFEEQQVGGIQVPSVGQFSVQTETRWLFESSDRRSGYVLLNSSLVYHTTEYSDFDVFVPEILRGYQVIASIAKIQRVQRIGLRYVDLIESSADLSAEEFVHPQLRGFGPHLETASERLSQYAFAGATRMGQLIFKVNRGYHETPLPLDLLPVTLKMPRVPNKDRLSIILDTDHFMERSEPPISGSEVSQLIRDLKKPISAAFKESITDAAVEAWK